MKTVYIGSHQVKLAGLLVYNVSALKDSLLLELGKDIDAFAKDDEEAIEVRKLLCKSVDLLMTHTTEIVEDIEQDILKQFPRATEIHLEMKYTPKK